MSESPRPVLFPSNRSMPKSTVIPVLSYPDVNEAAEWLCAAFGFHVRLRIANHRIQINTARGTGTVVVAEGTPPAAGAPSSHAIMVRVQDADRHCERAKEMGAIITSPPETYPYGERQYSAVDFAGHVWKFSQTVADADPNDWGGTLEFCAHSQP